MSNGRKRQNRVFGGTRSYTNFFGHICLRYLSIMHRSLQLQLENKKRKRKKSFPPEITIFSGNLWKNVHFNSFMHFYHPNTKCKWVTKRKGVNNFFLDNFNVFWVQMKNKNILYPFVIKNGKKSYNGAYDLLSLNKWNSVVDWFLHLAPTGKENNRCIETCSVSSFLYQSVSALSVHNQHECLMVETVCDHYFLIFETRIQPWS